MAALPVSKRVGEAPAEVLERARRVRVVLMDVDGVLTDGRILFLSNGVDGRSFHSVDGHGIRMGQRGGLTFAFVSGRRSEAVTMRARELGITEIHQGVADKIACCREILDHAGLAEENACFVGDDLVDVGVMRRVGLAVAPADAQPEALRAAHWVTSRKGGRGAVREVIDLLLRAAGTWDEVTRGYLGK